MLKMFSITLAGGTLFLVSSAVGQTIPDPTALDPVKVQQGMAIAPVPLNMKSLDPNLVGYGSYLVNASGDCNGCHSAGTATQYAKGGNPYFGQHSIVNPATYLGGGRDFGAFPNATGNFPHIISRNLTPDSSGLAVGGDTFDQFLSHHKDWHGPGSSAPHLHGAAQRDLYPGAVQRQLAASYVLANVQKLDR